MSRRLPAWVGLLILAFGAVSVAATAGSKRRPRDRDILWKIIDNCFREDGGGGYCDRCPAPLPSLLARCADPSGLDPVEVCRKTAKVWNRTEDFVAFADTKMCGCPDDFIHGLALPLRKVTGVEDKSKPAGLWRFAWDEAVKAIGADEKGAIILAVNPRWRRTQDQLHIHLIRLREGARRKLLDLGPVPVQDLSDVWREAARQAAASRLAEDGYAVGVAYDAAAGNFLVAISSGSLVDSLGVSKCKARGRSR